MLPFVSPLSKQTSLHLKPAHPKGESQKPARPKGGSQTLLAPSPGTASLLGRSGAGFGASARRPGWCSSKVRDSALRKVALFSFVIHRCRILLRSPGPRPPPVFRSAICDCLSLNVSVAQLSRSAPGCLGRVCQPTPSCPQQGLCSAVDAVSTVPSTFRHRPPHPALFHNTSFTQTLPSHRAGWRAPRFSAPLPAGC